MLKQRIAVVKNSAFAKWQQTRSINTCCDTAAGRHDGLTVSERLGWRTINVRGSCTQQLFRDVYSALGLSSIKQLVHKLVRQAWVVGLSLQRWCNYAGSTMQWEATTYGFQSGANGLKGCGTAGIFAFELRPQHG